MEQKQNNKLPNNRLQPKKNRRFSFSWFYTALFVFLIGAFLWSSPQADSKKVTYSEFQQQIEAGNVEAVVVYSSKKAEATLKQDSTEQAEDKAIQQKKKIHTQIISEEGFEAFLEKAKTEYGYTGSVDYEEDKDYLGMFLYSILPIVLILALLPTQTSAFAKCAITSSMVRGRLPDS